MKDDANLEWVVIDGDSELQDGHPEIFQRVNSLATHFISEPDNGIYDAMNKGTRLASGDYVLYLNAGDELHPDFDPEQLSHLFEETSPEMVGGSLLGTL